jgi:hypothetical protein
MTTFAERIFGRSFGRQPEIDDGVRGEALVLQSIAALTPSLMNMDQRIVGGWKAWACGIPLLMTLPGREPYAASPIRWMWRSKYPIGGTTLPVTVERGDPSMIRIEWDEVPELDDWIAAGHPVFTDPDSAQARYEEGWRTYRAATVDEGSRGVANEVAQAAGAASGIDAQRVQQLIADLQAEHAASSPQPTLKRPQIDGPSGRILAVGRQDGNASKSWGEVLLSVSVPGSPRYGARVNGYVPAAKVKLEWWDVPIDVDAKDPGKVKIRWDEVAGIEAVTPLLREASERLEARLSAAPATPTLDSYKGLLGAISDPAQRAQAERQLAQGLRLAAGQAADPLDELQRLGKLHAAGQLNDDEFATEKARLLGEM